MTAKLSQRYYSHNHQPCQLQYTLYIILNSKPRIRHDLGAYLATISRGIHIFLKKSDEYKLVVWEAYGFLFMVHLGSLSGPEKMLWADLEKLLRVVFFMFSRAKKFKKMKTL